MAVLGIGLVVSLMACADDPVAVTTGSIEVTAVTTGDGVDADGYTVLLDEASSGTIEANGSLELSEVEAGDHSIELTGLADGCAVDGDNPITVTVVAETTVAAGFAVVCAAA